MGKETTGQQITRDKDEACCKKFVAAEGTPAEERGQLEDDLREMKRCDGRHRMQAERAENMVVVLSRQQREVRAAMTAVRALSMDSWREDELSLVQEHDALLLGRKTWLEKEQQLVAQISEMTSSRGRLSAQCEDCSLTTQCMPVLITEGRRLSEQVSRLTPEQARKGTAYGRPVSRIGQVPVRHLRPMRM